jgi:phage I-like protein
MNMLKLVERGFFKSPAIKLSDLAAGPQGVNPPVQVLRVGKFNHPKYGEFEITKATLAEMKANFDSRIRGVDIAFDYFHESDKEASGWPTELFLTEDASELWAKVDWTLTAQKKLAEREIRYFSPDFAFQWQDPETGVVYKNVLFGGGLTNRPFVKDMAAIVAHEKNKGDSMDEKLLKELQEKIIKLSEDNQKMQDEHAAMKNKLEDQAPPAKVEDASDEEPADLEAAKKMLGEMKKKLAEYAEKEKVALAEKAKAEEAKMMAEKERDFNVLLTEGKACAAQKDSFLKNDMTAFIKLAQPVNLGGKGSSANGGNETGDREDRVLKLAEAKVKADPKLELHEAIKLANKEVQ